MDLLRPRNPGRVLGTLTQERVHFLQRFRLDGLL